MRSPVKWLDNEEYAVASIQEKALAWADHFAGKKVRETGINRGFWVEKFLASVGLGPGYAWCAAFSSYCIRQAGSSAGPGKGRAAVRNWASWSKASARTHVVPKRGDLVYTLNANGTGHIEFVTGVPTTTDWDQAQSYYDSVIDTLDFDTLHGWGEELAPWG